MDEQIYITALYDYYKGLLTDKQRAYFEDYYFDNLTMEEIALNNDVSKNAVSKSLMDVLKKLEEYESILHLYNNRIYIEKVLDEDTLNKINEYI